MSSIVITHQSVKFVNYDFTVDRSRMFSSEAHDGSMTIRMPGENRKTANHELIFVPYFKKYKLKFKSVAIGKSINRKIKEPIVVFDESDLLKDSAIIRKYGQTAGFVNSKGHALKMLQIFKIPLPKKPNEVIKIYFKLHPTQVNVNKLNYRICTLSILRIIKNEDYSKYNTFAKRKKKVKRIGLIKKKKEISSLSSAPQNII